MLVVIGIFLGSFENLNIFNLTFTIRVIAGLAQCRQNVVVFKVLVQQTVSQLGLPEAKGALFTQLEHILSSLYIKMDTWIAAL